MLPIIDFSGFRTGEAERRRAVADEIGRALETIGFFYVRGHGIAEATLAAARTAAETYFRRPAAEKLVHERAPGRYRGYIPPIPFTSANAVEGRPPILYEAFIVGPEVAPDDPAVASTAGLLWPTPWPAEPIDFRAAVTAYWQAADGLAMDLLRAFALALGAPEEALVKHFRKPLTNMSLLHYLARPAGGARAPVAHEPGRDDVPPHYDTNAVTLLAPGAVGGLQVQRRDGHWIQAEPLPGCLVVNIGNMMECWSGGRYRSTLHRVHPPLGRERYSIAHFATPDYDTRVAPLPGTVKGTAQPPEPIHAGRTLAAFVARFDPPVSDGEAAAEGS
ncbi:MAG: 2-oxoglutarate and iron-dependent oxygenase domain-containing protein [Kiloniellales bacterium]|nr:2-oxoglutarate and iron-dependent oxygenase domain-containing protein [Kiloniellales bacterium]